MTKFIAILVFISTAATASQWECAAFCGGCNKGFTDCRLADVPKVLTSEDYSLNRAFEKLEAQCKTLIPAGSFPVLASGNRNTFTAVLPSDACRHTP